MIYLFFLATKNIITGDYSLKKEGLFAIAQVAVKNIKMEQSLSRLTKMLSKITIDVTLNVEQDDHWSTTVSAKKLNYEIL